MYNSDFDTSWNLKVQTIHLMQNHANKSGSSVYGGLLDRCAVSQFAEVHHNKNYATNPGGINYFRMISNTTNTDTVVSSLPVKVCLCGNKHINCTDKHQVEVRKGHSFTVSVSAVDQIGKTVNGTIQTSLNFTESGLAEGQLT